MRRQQADLVLLDDEIWYAPDGVYEMGCVARTVKNRRCRKPLEYGQIAGWTRMRSTGGLIEVYDLGGRSDVAGRWLAQHCELHDAPGTVDFQSPDWERFDPARHAEQVTPLDDWIEAQRRKIMEGVTGDWEPWYPTPS